MINRVINIGTECYYSLKKNELIKLINFISIFGVIVSIVYVVIGQINSKGILYFEILSALLLTLPLLLNHFKKHELAKITIISSTIVLIYLGTYLTNYERNFKFGIVVPIALLYMFFGNEKSWKLYLPLSLVTIYLVITEYLHYSKISNIPESKLVNSYYDLALFVLIIIGFTFMQRLFNKKTIQIENDLVKRIEYEKMITDFSEAILASSKDKGIESLKNIVEITGVSSIYLYENILDPNNVVCAKLTHEVCAPEIESQISNPALQKISYIKAGFSRWVNHFEKNEIVYGVVDDFPESEQKTLKSLGIKSILLIPIFVNKEWNGFVGLDDNDKTRIWQEEDIRLLRTVADIIGLYKENDLQKRIISVRNDELMALNAIKDKYFSIISHDLRSPFSGLLALTKILSEEFDEISDEEKKEMINHLLFSTKSIYELLDGLLEWASAQRGSFKFEPKTIDLLAVGNSVFQLLKLNAGKKNIDLICNFSNNENVFADPIMITTVIRNLAANAIKFTNSGGRIVFGYNSTKEGMAEFFIQDNGVGIPNDRLNQLFSIDRNVSTKGTNGESGTGFGLHLCKEFIEKHGGNIKAESIEGQGSTFTFSLPEKDIRV